MGGSVIGPLPRRLDLTQPRPGQRIYRAITLTPGADGGARLSVHAGRAELGADLSADDLWQLIGMISDVQFANTPAEVSA